MKGKGMRGLNMANSLDNTRPIEDDLRKRIAELEMKIRHNALWQASEDAEERAHLEKLVPDLKKRIAELEAKIDQLTAHDATERQDDKLSEREVCEVCGGDGTVLLRDGYEGQVIATAKCIYCNGTGRVSKESEE